MPGNGNVENTQSRAEDAHAHENSKPDDPAHDVQQARAGDSMTVAIVSPNGSNVVANADHGPDGAHTHANQHDDHSVAQARVDGNLVVLVENDHGMNAVVITATGEHQHVNTMSDGWVI